MGDRDAGPGGHGDRAAHPRDDLPRNPRLGAGEGLFPTPPEDERIAPLEPHHDPAGQGVVHEEGVDVLLPAGVISRRLADEDALRLGRRLRQQGFRDQPVVDHHLGPA
jgi:hypothetical protein